MNATILLCDWAEAVNGKLYVLGGGWSRMTANQPVPLALAIKLGVDWDQANKKIPIKVTLVTEDGQSVIINDQPVVLDAGVEVGRPAGTKPGSTLDAILVFRFPGLTLDLGGYSWIVEAGGEEAGRIPFDAVAKT